MKGIVIRAVGAPRDALKLESNFAAPVVKAGEILVKNYFSGVNYIDTYHRTGLYPLPLPFVPGKEGAGIVEAVGEGVTDFSVGQRIAFLGAGSYSQYVSVPTKHVLPLPEDVSFELGAAVLLQGLTASYLTHKSYAVKSGDYVLVPAAAGGTGGLVCRLAKKAGARVIGIVSTEEKAVVARAAGADEVILHRSEDIQARVKEITNNKGVKVVYDGVGKPLYKTFLNCLSRQGSYIYFGNAGGKIDSIDPFDLTPKCLTFMRPSLFGYIDTREEFLELSQHVLDLLKNDREVIHIHKIYPLENAAESHEDLESGATIGKLLLAIPQN